MMDKQDDRIKRTMRIVDKQVCLVKPKLYVRANDYIGWSK